jgi:hypothetical protein
MFVPGSDPDLADWIAADMASAPPEIAIDAMRHAMSNDRAMPGLLMRLTAVVAINPASKGSSIGLADVATNPAAAAHDGGVSSLPIVAPALPRVGGGAPSGRSGVRLMINCGAMGGSPDRRGPDHAAGTTSNL